MALPLDQLAQPVSADSVRASIYALLKAAGLPVTSWKEGSVIRTIIAVLAQVISTFTNVVAVITQGGFLDLATGIYLTLLAHYVYGVDRIEATFATGEVTLTNTAGGLYTFGPGDLIVSNPTTGATYANTTTFTLQPVGNPGAVVTIPVQATEVGAASTSAPHTITGLVTGLNGVSVDNANPIVGQDAETDDALRVRCRDALGALSPNGPQAAYEFFAKTTARSDGTIIAVNRVQVTAQSSTGQVSVWFASPSGPITDPTDLAIIDANIQTHVVPIGITCTTQSATAVPVTVQYTAYADAASGLLVATLQAKIAAALTAFFSSYPIGGRALTRGGQGYLFASKIRAVIVDADPSIFQVSVTLPAADVALNAGQIATLTIDPGSTLTLVAQ